MQPDSIIRSTYETVPWQRSLAHLVLTLSSAHAQGDFPMAEPNLDERQTTAIDPSKDAVASQVDDQKSSRTKVRSVTSHREADPEQNWKHIVSDPDVPSRNSS